MTLFQLPPREHGLGTISRSGIRACRTTLTRMYFFSVLSLMPLVASGASGDRNAEPLVQQIGELSGDLFAAISQQVRIIPFSPSNNVRTTPIIFPGGLVLSDDGSVTGLRNIERRAIKRAYRSGQTVVILDASVHDIQALHALLGEGAAYDSTTDHVVAAYTLRRIKGIPTARSLSYVRLGPREAVIAADESLAFTRAIDIVVDDLQPLADSVPESAPGAAPASWTDSPVQSTILTTNAAAGVFNTTVKVYALHECATGFDQYVVTSEADWTATQAKFQSASSQDGTLRLDSDLNLVPEWQDNRDRCTGGVDLASGNSVCRYTNYPLQYQMTVRPPTTGTVLQVQAAPAATQGTTTSYSSGFEISIGGDVNISGDGPSAGIQAGVSWNNTTTVDVPAVLVKAGDTGNEGAFWDYVYCTSGDNAGNCTSHVQMKNPSGSVCLNYEMGDPQNGQTPDGRMSATGQSVQFEAEPNTRIGDTFDIEVTFTADLATTTTNLWYGPFINDPGLYCAKNGIGPSGNCNCFGCSCGNNTVKNPVSTTHTFEVPFPSTQCTN